MKTNTLTYMYSWLKNPYRTQINKINRKKKPEKTRMLTRWAVLRTLIQKGTVKDVDA